MLFARCEDLIWGVARQVLACGQDVVLDWNQWSRQRRARWRGRARTAGYGVLLHHVDVPLVIAVRQARLRTRDQVPWSHELTDDGIRHLADLFEPPAADEGIPVRVHGHGTMPD